MFTVTSARIQDACGIGSDCQSLNGRAILWAGGKSIPESIASSQADQLSESATTFALGFAPLIQVGHFTDTHGFCGRVHLPV